MNHVTLANTSNAILAGLEDEEKNRLNNHLTYHEVTLGENFFEAGDTIDFFFFPIIQWHLLSAERVKGRAPR